MTKPQAPDDVLAVVGVGKWVLDEDRSSVTLASKTLWGMGTVHGEFATFSGVGTLGQDGAIQGRLEIESASVNTRNKTRDGHLRSADYFNVQAHPRIVVDVLDGRLANGREVHLNAQLTIVGLHKPLQFVATVVDPSTDEVTLKAEVRIHQLDFGMTTNPLRMMKGPATLSVVATFTRDRLAA
jgi:polyisoprenoid-binding protein YceI